MERSHKHGKEPRAPKISEQCLSNCTNGRYSRRTYLHVLASILVSPVGFRIFSTWTRPVFGIVYVGFVLRYQFINNLWGPQSLLAKIQILNKNNQDYEKLITSCFLSHWNNVCDLWTRNSFLLFLFHKQCIRVLWSSRLWKFCFWVRNGNCSRLDLLSQETILWLSEHTRI
jgi:hypothetical protein